LERLRKKGRVDEGERGLMLKRKQGNKETEKRRTGF